MVAKSSIRKNMVEEIMKEVQGPRYGVDEIISYDPLVEYLTGIIYPYNWIGHDYSEDPDKEITYENDNSNSEDGTVDDAILVDFDKHIDPRLPIKSFGFSFSLDIPNPKFSICATWGRYFTDKVHRTGKYLRGEDKEAEGKNRIRERCSFGEIFEIDFNDKDYDDTIEIDDSKENELVIIKTLKNFESDKEINIEEDNDYVKIYIKRLKVDELYTFSIYMINYIDAEQDPKEKVPKVRKCLFQPSIRLNCNHEIKGQHTPLINETEEELDFLYKKRPTKSVGHMCSVVWKDIDYPDKISMEQLWPDYQLRLKNNKKYEEFLKPDIRSDFLPLYPVTLPSFDLGDYNEFDENDLKAEVLANKSPEDIAVALVKLTKPYQRWINSNKDKLNNISDENDLKIAKRIIKHEDEALNRIISGIDLIKSNDLVYTSFCFANKTIALQNKWGKEDPKPFKWRPFQIAFILMNLEDIYEDGEKRDVLDLLWIPTGGGKTESYLGIMAYTIALRRLKAYKEHKTGAGTSIISRYTLRLLTVQQFRRTLKMITAAEFLRVNKSDNGIGWRPKYSKINGDWIYGSTRFSTGLWVGSGVTPNHLYEDNGALKILETGEVRSFGYKPGEPAQIIKCPVCGSWLSIPNTGLTDDINNLYIVIKSSISVKELEIIFNELFPKNTQIEFIGITSKNHKFKHYTVSLKITGLLSKMKYAELIYDKIEDSQCEVVSLGVHNLGYFNSLEEIPEFHKTNNSKDIHDFEIWCTNPECDLNNIEWAEGCPAKTSIEPDFPDKNCKREIFSPFKDNTRMPIPAYLIDDHIYHRCPTVVISTADKIARLAFEPRVSAIFGNVNCYNEYYGYHRDDMLPKGHISVRRFDEKIDALKAPDLIIQDELHLIEGPLGSLFGLYEAMVSGIIKKQKGNPKYIASTATISNAEKQVDVLFSKKLFQFPPHGMDISDNFFVKDIDSEDAWDPNIAGRLYMGLYTPGHGGLKSQMKLWARMLSASNLYKDDVYSRNYWTVLSYYNSIRELGTTLALYRDVIKSRVKTISPLDDYRKLSEEFKEELSGRISSTDLPLVLDNLEKDGIKDAPKYDAIFTTSMFGTGVDVSHLSLMLMNSQPKTTGSYIQATGRIGRNKGGLIVDFFKYGRARDLNYYEMFCSFHSRMYLGVEPVSVSPFSTGCLARGLGPAMVSFLRNACDLSVDWTSDEDGLSPILNNDSEEDIGYIYDFLKERLENMDYVDDETKEPVLESLKESADNWRKVAKGITDRRLLKMFEYYMNKPKQNVVLGSAGHEHIDNLKVVYKNAPQSLRDVEEEIDFWV